MALVGVFYVYMCGDVWSHLLPRNITIITIITIISITITIIIDDTHNIARVALRMMEDGHVFKKTFVKKNKNKKNNV